MGNMKKVKLSLAVVMAFTALALQPARAEQTKLRDALAHLREARAALVAANHNKEGHRVRAIEIVDKAIVEVQAGLAAGR